MWDKVEQVVKEFSDNKLNEVLNYDEFNRISIVHHSSAIEGSTLTLLETQLLLREGTTAKGKPMEHHLMLQDHLDALNYVLLAAEKKEPVNVLFIRNINAKVMQRTGVVINTVLGSFDSSKGELRKLNVTAGDSYFVNYEKVPSMLNELCDTIQSKINTINSVKDILQLSFDAHYYLVSIHPFADGNGRTSRLLMNYIQQYFKLPLAIVYAEDKKEYIESLKKSREENSPDSFREFMCDQYVRYLNNEIKKSKDQGGKLSFLL